jgi:hypothetical protein
MHRVHQDSAVRAESHAFALKQGTLHRQAALIAAESPVGAYCTMTWDDDREWVRGQSIADSSSRSWFPQMHREQAVCAHAPAWYSVLCAQHSLLKRRAQIQLCETEGEPDSRTVEGRHDVGADSINHRASRHAHIGEERRRFPHGGEPRPGKNDSGDLRSPPD